MVTSRFLSKVRRFFGPAWLPLLFIFIYAFNAAAQDVSVTISVGFDQPSKVNVSGRYSDSFRPESRNFYFSETYAGIENLGKRFSDVKVYDRSNQNIGIKQLIPGEFLAERPINRWEYSLDASPPNSNAASAHISWSNENRGVLFLDDILPQSSPSARPKTLQIELKVPPDWDIFSSEEKKGNSFIVSNPEKAVFVLSRKGIVRQLRSTDSSIRLFVDENWSFSDEEAVAISSEIFNCYKRLFGPLPVPGSIYLSHFWRPVSAGSWEADTRGNSTLIFSSEMPFKNQSIQRLHEQLRHELFHLWVPNNLSLTGNYDWFYEGFALYISLKQGVVVNRLRFDDFLDTLARAYSIENFQPSAISLLQASKDRWSGANTRLYARGMLTAFLCDIELLQRSRAKAGVEKLVREVIDRYKIPAQQKDGNEAILELFAAYNELAPIIDKYIKGSEKINWQNELTAAGITSTEENMITRLNAIENPKGRQKDLLNALGYNNWRNLSPASK